MLGRRDSPAALPRKGGSSPQQASVAIIIDPIDLLQNINRKYDFDVGDRVLETLLQRLSDAEPSAAVARYEEDAFSMTMTASIDHASAAELAWHLSEVVRQPMPGVEDPVRARVMIVFDPAGSTSTDSLLELCTQLMDDLARRLGYAAAFEVGGDLRLL